jgi:hypothetical protein
VKKPARHTLETRNPLFDNSFADRSTPYFSTESVHAPIQPIPARTNVSTARSNGKERSVI